MQRSGRSPRPLWPIGSPTRRSAPNEQNPVDIEMCDKNAGASIQVVIVWKRPWKRRKVQHTIYRHWNFVDRICEETPAIGAGPSIRLDHLPPCLTWATGVTQSSVKIAS